MTPTEITMHRDIELQKHNDCYLIGCYGNDLMAARISYADYFKVLWFFEETTKQGRILKCVMKK